MKLITLNAWSGKIAKPLEKFLKDNSSNIDIFCFQEVTNGFYETDNEFFKSEILNKKLYEDISKNLPNHNGFFCPVYKEIYGIAIFVKKDIKVEKSGSIFTYKNKLFPDPKNPEGDHDRKMQWIKISSKNKNYLIMSLHGHWKENKLDDKNTIKQSEKMLEFSQKSNLPQVLCGDFNLRPNTKSIEMLENAGFTNLIKKNKVKTTRTSYYKKNEKFADYIFTSPKIKVNKFEVMKQEVSDHCALFIDFE